MIANLKREKMENANPQKQDFGSLSLPPSLPAPKLRQAGLRYQSHDFFCQRTRISMILLD